MIRCSRPLVFGLLAAVLTLSASVDQVHAQDMKRFRRRVDPGARKARVPSFLNKPQPKKKRSSTIKIEELFIPAEGFKYVLKRFPKGVFLRSEEWNSLVDRASKWQPKVAVSKPDFPATVVMQSANYSGTYYAQNRAALFNATAEIVILDDEWHSVELPNSASGLGNVKVNGKSAHLIQSKRGNRLLLQGPGRFKLEWVVTTAVKVDVASNSASLNLPLIAAASGHLTLETNGDNQVEALDKGAYWISAAKPTSEKTAETAEAKTVVHTAIGGRDSVSFRFRPRETVNQKQPYLIAHSDFGYEVEQGVLHLTGSVDLEVLRQARQKFQIKLPAGVIIRTLTAEGSPSWYQQNQLVTIELPEPTIGRFKFQFAAERPIALGRIQIKPILVVADRQTTDIAIWNADRNLTLSVMQERQLQRYGSINESKSIGSKARKYRAEDTDYTLEIETARIEGKISLAMTALHEYSRNELKSRVILDHRVLQGSIFQSQVQFDRDLDLESVTVELENGQALPFDWQEELRTLESGESVKVIAVNFESDAKAGQVVSMTLDFQRVYRNGLDSESQLAIPSIKVLGQKAMTGYIGVAIDGRYELDVRKMNALNAVPAKELVNLSGIVSDELALGYQVLDSNYSAVFALNPKAIYLFADLEVAHSVQESLLQTEALFHFDSKAAPIESLSFLVPKGKAMIVDVQGIQYKERVVVTPPKAFAKRYEGLQLKLTRPVNGTFKVRLSYDQKVDALAGGNKTVAELELPKVKCLESRRESGTIAVFSSDSTDIAATGQQIRRIDVASLDSKFYRRSRRPLHSFRYVREDYSLKLSITRFSSQEILTALCEKLSITSSVDPSGLMRHDAVFELKNLSHQFLNLRLPFGSKLWSVQVNGFGIKPAKGENASHILPLPSQGAEAGAKTTRLRIVYEEVSKSLHISGMAQVDAPELFIATTTETRTVPVVETNWQLAVPDSQRILDVSGDLNQGQGGQNVFVVQLGSRIYREMGVDGIAFVLALIFMVWIVWNYVLGAVFNAAKSAASSISWWAVAKVMMVIVVLYLVALALSPSVLSSKSPERRRFLGSTSKLGAVRGLPESGEDYDGIPQEPNMQTAAYDSKPMQSAKRDDAKNEFVDMVVETKSKEGYKRPSAKRQQKLLKKLSRPEYSNGRLMPKKMEQQRGRRKSEPQSELMVKERMFRRNSPGKKSMAPARVAKPSPKPNAPPPPPAAEDVPAEAPDQSKPEFYGEPVPVDADAEDFADAEKPIVVLEEEVEITKDVPKGTDLSSLRNKNLSADKYGVGGGAATGYGYGQSGGRGRGDKRRYDAGLNAEDRKTAGVDIALEKAKTGQQMNIAGLMGDDNFAEGLKSLVFEMPQVGRVYSMSSNKSQVKFNFSLWSESRYQQLSWLSILAGFIISLLVFPRREKQGVIALTFLAIVALTATAYAIASSGFGFVVINGLSTGILLALPVHGAFQLFKNVRAKLAESKASRPGIRVSAKALSLLLGAIVLGHAAPAQANPAFDSDGDKAHVFVPLRKDSLLPQNRVYVPRDLFESLYGRAYPKAEEIQAVRQPSAVSFSTPLYSLKLENGQLSATVDLEVHTRVRWTSVQLGLKGLTAVSAFNSLDLTDVNGNKITAKVARNDNGLVVIFDAPGLYKIRYTGQLASTNGKSYEFTPVPVAAGLLKFDLTGSSKRVVFSNRRVVAIEKTENDSRVLLASLGSTRTLKFQFTDPEVLSSAGDSNASVRNNSYFQLSSTAISQVSELEFSISGGGRDGFQFELPESLEVLSVIGQRVGTWQVESKEIQGKLRRVLEVRFRQSVSGRCLLTVRSEVPLDQLSSVTLPEIKTLGVKREYGNVVVGASSGLKLRYGAGGSLYQIDSTALTIPGSVSQQFSGYSVDAAYEYGRRPTTLGVTISREKIDYKVLTRSLSFIGDGLERWVLNAEFRMTKGDAAEFGFDLPEGLAIKSVRSEQGKILAQKIEQISGKRWFVVEFDRKLGQRCEITIEAERELRQQEGLIGAPTFESRIVVRNPELQIVSPQKTSGRCVIAAKAGIELNEAEAPKSLSAVDVELERLLRPLRAEYSSRLAFRYSESIRKPYFSYRRLTPKVRGTFTLHAHVFPDSVRYGCHLAYAIERSPASSFRFRLPARFAGQVRIQAPNSRTIAFETVSQDKTEFVEYEVKLQSGVLGSYEMTLKFEEIAANDRRLRIPPVLLTGCDLARGYVLLEKDAEVQDELVFAGKLNADRCRADQVSSLPPNRTVNSFLAAYRMNQPQSGSMWKLAYDLKAVKMGRGPSAFVDWAELTSVVHSDGRILNRVRYQVRNRRLQFLELSLPKGAQVWSVLVGRRSKKLYSGQNGHSLVPLPKKVLVDPSIEIELIYETRLSSGFGNTVSFAPPVPELVDKELTPENSFWNLYLPDDYHFYDFEGELDQTDALVLETRKLNSTLNEVAAVQQMVEKNPQAVNDEAMRSYRNLIRVAQARLNQCQALQSRLNEHVASLRSQGKSTSKQVSALRQGATELRKMKAQITSLRGRLAPSNGDEQNAAQVQDQRRAQLFSNSQMSSWRLNYQVVGGKKMNWANTGKTQKQRARNILRFADKSAAARSQLANFDQLKDVDDETQKSREKLVKELSSYVNRQSQVANSTNAQELQLGQDLIDNIQRQQNRRESEDYTDRNKSERKYKNAIDRGLRSLTVHFRTPGRKFSFVTDQRVMKLRVKGISNQFVERLKSWLMVLSLLILGVTVASTPLTTGESNEWSLLSSVKLLFFAMLAFFVFNGWQFCLVAILLCAGALFVARRQAAESVSD